MDPVTWNAYQIVSNRARAVCYATRQQHFRMKTEFTVNHLVNTAQEQLNSLHKLQVKQHPVDCVILFGVIQYVCTNNSGYLY